MSDHSIFILWPFMEKRLPPPVQVGKRRHRVGQWLAAGLGRSMFSGNDDSV